MRQITRGEGILVYRGLLEIKQPLLFGISARKCKREYQHSSEGRLNPLTLQNDVQALHLAPNFEAILHRLHTVENNHCEWSLLLECSYYTGQLVHVLLVVDLAWELVEILVTGEENHRMWVMEVTKGLMIAIVVPVVGVAMNLVGADGSAEMIERAKLMQHGQQAARSLL